MKNRVLIIGYTSGVGGVETYISNLDKFIDRAKFDISYLIHEDINSKYINLISKESKIFKIIGIKKNFFKFLKDIFKFYHLNNFDTVYLNECSANMFVYCIPILFNSKIKFVVHSHNGDSKNKFIHKILRLFQNCRADSKIACSEVAYKWMFGNRTKDMKIINNGIELEKYKYNLDLRIKKRRELGIENKYVIGNIGRFEIQKNHEFIIDLFYEYLKNNDNAVLVLVGDGSLKNMIKNKVNDMKIQKYVYFLNNRNDIPELLMAFDVFLLPSLYEGLPFVAIESQASSLPIIVSKNIDDAIDLTPIIYFEKLDNEKNKWIEKIEKSKEINRIKSDSNKILKNKKFDVKDVIGQIEKELTNCK